MRNEFSDPFIPLCSLLLSLNSLSSNSGSSNSIARLMDHSRAKENYIEVGGSRRERRKADYDTNSNSDSVRRPTPVEGNAWAGT